MNLAAFSVFGASQGEQNPVTDEIDLIEKEIA